MKENLVFIQFQVLLLSNILMIDSTSLTFKNEFNDVFCIYETMCLTAASLTQLSM